ALLIASAAAARGEPSASFAQAQSLERRGYLFGAFFHFAAIVQAGPSHPDYLRAIEAASATAEQLRDEVVAPHLFEKIPADTLAALPAAPRARIAVSLALLAYRSGRH